ncbi:helix-turn-helix domain-containing protein [Williamsia sp. 1135]|uniref:helix-turn-helix domain-containing protein n=1 Tax=Williamsia sp. 1135 TaxID=1889262 RepID=UPI000A10D133|nr:helix-turn-helix domain-containing protein [Williamsia sp. 1135]ORM38176.1 hypothetical protein BFL43_00920 [Williamsia sp. 1135]
MDGLDIRVHRPGEVTLGPAEVRYLAAALAEVERSMRARGMQLIAPVQSLKLTLESAGRYADNPANGTADHETDTGASLLRNDLLTSQDAARILKCGRDNLRALARRGTIIAHKNGGRWFYDAESVHQRAAQRR